MPKKLLLILTILTIFLSSALMGCIEDTDESWKTESVDGEYTVSENTVLTVQN